MQTDCIRTITESIAETDSEDFTSDSDAAIDEEEDDSSSESEFVLTIASPPPYEPDAVMPQEPTQENSEEPDEKDEEAKFIDLPDLMDIDAVYPTTSSEEDLTLAEEESDGSSDPDYDPEHTNATPGSDTSQTKRTSSRCRQP